MAGTATRRRRLGMVAATVLSVVLAIPPAAAERGGGDRGCADILAGIALGPFPPEVGDASLFYAWEGQPNAAFSVRFAGEDCGQQLAVQADYFDSPGSATEPADYSVADGQTPPVSGPAGPYPQTQSVAFTANADGSTGEQVAESFTIALRNPAFGVLQPPSTASVAVVDQDGASRFGFADVALSQSETYPNAKIPVFRAGPAASAAQVSFDLVAGPSSPATPGTDFTPTSGTISFAAGQRVAAIGLTITDDREPERAEQLTVKLRDPSVGTTITGDGLFTIEDNEERIAPRSLFHHPRQGLKYARADYRLREIHVFTSDQGGSKVVEAQMALRKNLGKGNCRWWSGKKWKRGKCSAKRWVKLSKYETDFFYYRIGSLRPSMGTAIKSYTAFSRARDGAGNVESTFDRGRNANTFDVRAGEPKG